MWDLMSSFLRCHTPATPLLHPLIQVAAHIGPCRCVSWCPLDSNYLFTGTHTHTHTHTRTHTILIDAFLLIAGGQDKFMNLWDIRQPHTPRERQEKSQYYASFSPSSLHLSFSPSLSPSFSPSLSPSLSFLLPSMQPFFVGQCGPSSSLGCLQWKTTPLQRSMESSTPPSSTHNCLPDTSLVATAQLL